jgi:hypothetical protein
VADGSPQMTDSDNSVLRKLSQKLGAKIQNINFIIHKEVLFCKTSN